MILTFIQYTITFILIFTTLYSYGLTTLKIFNYQKQSDIFCTILIGYTFIGILTVILHFFFRINNEFSIILVLFGVILFIKNYNKNFKKEFLFFLISLIILSPLLFGYSDHPIDANMYHHPYVSYLKSEKIIFGIANIQFRFGHISFLQYVQSIFTNDFFHIISLSSINIIFYFAFIFFISKKIILKNKFDYPFLVNILIVSFLLIKFARYREYGNDLIPLLVGFYFLILIVEEIYKPTNFKNILIGLILPFFAFMFAHKISYIFTVFIFLVLINYKNFKFLREIRVSYILIFIFILVPWLIKNYITTSCFAYPVEISCFSNQIFGLSGAAMPANAAWLSEVWAKAFIAHPNWQNIDLGEYVSGFNWVSTWMNSHFIKILEITSPLFLIIFLLSVGLFVNRRNIFYNSFKLKVKNKILYLFLLIFLGLAIWFYNAPVFRYGAFYIISLIIIVFISFLNIFFKLKNFKKLNFFKNIFFICIVFFVLKNTIRIYKSDNIFFPKTIVNKSENSFEYFEIQGLKLSRTISNVCYYTRIICSHEIPSNINIKKWNNYYVVDY